MLLDIVRTGSASSRTAAYWAGQVDDKTCQLCMEEDNAPEPMWTCKALEKARREANVEIANVDPNRLPMSVKCGIAPALKANIEGPFWGGRKHRKTSMKSN